MREVIRILSPEEAEEMGYKTFVNEKDHKHVCIDLSDIDETKEQTTISVNLPKGQQVTFCIMDLGNETDIDISIAGSDNHRMIGFKKEEAKSEELTEIDLYALVSRYKGK